MARELDSDGNSSDSDEEDKITEEKPPNNSMRERQARPMVSKSMYQRDELSKSVRASQTGQPSQRPKRYQALRS